MNLFEVEIALLTQERDDARSLLTQARVAVEHERDRLSDCEHDPAFCTCDEAARTSVLLAKIDALIVDPSEMRRLRILERDEARAIVGSCWLTYSEGERDKARAWAHKCERERDEARAEVDRLKRERDAAYMAAGEYSQDEVNAMTTEMIALRKEYEKSAYRRGAEAMREACANAFAEYEGAGLSAQILAMELPIPEEP